MHQFNFVLVIVSLSYEPLQLTHCHVLCLDLSSLSFDGLQLFGLEVFMLSQVLQVSIMSIGVQSSKKVSSVNLHDIFVIFTLLFLDSSFKISALVLKVHSELLSVLILPFRIEYGLFHSLFILALFFIKLGCLVSNSIYLTIQNKLLPNHIQLLLFQVLLVLLVDPSHFHVLAFQ
jgi:hypothetical protein